jgi:hypothetical protein
MTATHQAQYSLLFDDNMTHDSVLNMQVHHLRRWNASNIGFGDLFAVLFYCVGKGKQRPCFIPGTRLGAVPAFF